MGRSKYEGREFRLGEYWLAQRGESPAWYRFWYDEETGRTNRSSLGTTDFEEAKRVLTEWYILNREVRNEKPSEALLADVLRRYYTEHGSKTRSHQQARVAVNHWLDFWKTDTVADARDVRKQERFHAALRERGIKAASINRIIGIGKAALNRAWKRGELEQPPHIVTVKAEAADPRGRPMSVDEIAKLYANAAAHLQTFILWMLGTAARPEAILTLVSSQVDWESGLIHLNPPGRQQNKKRRPTVRLPQALSERRFDGRLASYEGQAVRSIKTAWRRACERAELDDECRPYSLRHTSARWMRRNGVSMDEVSQQLGHRSKETSTTALYTADDPAYLENACMALNGLVTAVLNQTRASTDDGTSVIEA